MTYLENLTTCPAVTTGLLDSFFLAQQQLRDPQPQALLPNAGGTCKKKELRQPTRCGCMAYSGPLLFMAPEGVQRHGNKVRAKGKKGSPEP
jgi:hypothetical protein